MERKLRILCLHGYRQDADKFRSQTGSLRKLLKNLVEMTFISAPHFLPAEGETSRSWWFTQESSYSSRDAPETCRGLDEALRLVEQFWINSGPFDGLLGFSQGACLVGLISGLCQKGQLSITPKFVVLYAGFKSFTKEHEYLYKDIINISSLQIFGETDEVIPCQWGEDLAKVFANPVILKHSGGHFVPGTSALRPNYVSFFEEQKKRIAASL